MCQVEELENKDNRLNSPQLVSEPAPGLRKRRDKLCCLSPTESRLQKASDHAMAGSTALARLYCDSRSESPFSACSLGTALMNTLRDLTSVWLLDYLLAFFPG